ncbi:MAG: GNAT family N-acetyltransferase [Verrucomicrobiota bacterium]
MNELRIFTVQGEALSDYIEAIAALRIEVFREWPYCYDGSIDYERRYLQSYIQSPSALVVIAETAGRIVGASTALPLIDADPAFAQAFEGTSLPKEDIIYYGESVVLPAYRGRGIGAQFFQTREAHASALGKKFATFCAIERPPNNTRQPANYRPLDSFWQRQGFNKQPAIQATFDWREIGETVECSHTLSFWIKELNTATP